MTLSEIEFNIDELEREIKYNILVPLYNMIQKGTREKSRMYWGLYDGKSIWYGCTPKIWYTNDRVSIVILDDILSIRHINKYVNFYLTDVDFYDKAIYWLSKRMPIILGPYVNFKHP